MKKFLTIAMMLCFVGGLTACQQSDRTKKQPNGTPNSDQQHSGTSSDQTQKKDENSSY